MGTDNDGYYSFNATLQQQLAEWRDKCVAAEAEVERLQAIVDSVRGFLAHPPTGLSDSAYYVLAQLRETVTKAAEAAGGNA